MRGKQLEPAVVATASKKVKRQGSHLETKSFFLGDVIDLIRCFYFPTVALVVLGIGTEGIFQDTEGSLKKREMSGCYLENY